MAKATAKKPLTKTQIFANISEATGLSKKDVAAVFDAMTDEIRSSLAKRGPRAFTLPGLCKILVHHKKARPEREGRNPQTGETMMFAAKPACDVVKVRPLKALKDMIL
jgi:nucleoid DNA-binding protein